MTRTPAFARNAPIDVSLARQAWSARPPEPAGAMPG